MKITVNTEYNDEMIKSTAVSEHFNPLAGVHKISEGIIKLQDQGVREALINLGWKEPKTCEWKRDRSGDELFNEPLSLFYTGCGNAFEFTFDGIDDNRFKFCPYCGGTINEPKASDEQ